jgi:hypothetical protein
MSTQQTYPDTRGFKYSQSGTEIRLGRKIFTTFKCTHSQAIEEGIIGQNAATPEVIGRTRGKLQPGDGTLETDDVEEAQAFIDMLAEMNGGDGFSDVMFNILIRYTSPNRPAITREIFSARVLDDEEDPGDGVDGVQSSFPISFMYRKLGGKLPFKNQRT